VNPEFFSWRKNVWHWFVNVRRLVTKFDHVVAVSEHTRRDLIEICGLAPERVSTVFSAIDESFKVIDKTDQKLAELKNKYNLNKPFILFLSTLEPRKNIEGLIAAFALLKKKEQYREYQLVLAGGKGWKAEAIFKAIKNSGCSQDIRILDYVPAEERVYLYNLATVFAYPSFYEGFGFPPLEAMASGTPVVAAAASSIPEIIGDAGILVDPYNPAAIALGLETILSDKTLAQELSRKGLVRAKEFNWNQAAESYLQLFKDICQSKTNTLR
jgi:glycosyltransferase involved in cell wall biosynthesis